MTVFLSHLLFVFYFLFLLSGGVFFPSFHFSSNLSFDLLLHYTWGKSSTFECGSLLVPRRVFCLFFSVGSALGNYFNDSV